MNFTFKLARRIARLRRHLPRAPRNVLLLLTVVLAAACNSDGPNGPIPPAEVAQSAEVVHQGPPAPASDLVPISPGQSIQDKVNSSPAGTQFLIKAGSHNNQRIVPKSGDVFIGEPGAILDGRNATPYAFEKGRKPYPNDVRISGLIIQNYSSPDQQGAISAGASREESTTGWIVEKCEVRYNQNAGIKLGNKMKVLSNNIHNNRRIGIAGSGDSVLVEGNEIAFNNYQNAVAFGSVLGGAKFVNVRWLIARGNNVHDNQGNGLWTDIGSINILFEGNTLVNNSGTGILHEIGYDAIIRNNTVKGNGYARGDWVMGAGILISSSANAEVYGNTVLDNKDGIVGIQQNRKGGNYSSNLKNLYIHNNTVRVPLGGVSGVADGTGNLAYTSRNNRFLNNSYDLGSDPKVFTWMGSKRTKAEWQKYGNDLNGTFY